MEGAEVKKLEQEIKEYEINVLYKNGEKVNLRTKLDDKELSKHVNVIGMCYKEDTSGFLSYNGTFIRIAETCQVQIKEIPPTLKEE